ncbi:MAG: Ig-like domain-containing protein [Chitinophagaceae bacterium]|nr:Ig-like domain-containing protein [Chitinophagaceae bacterium]
MKRILYSIAIVFVFYKLVVFTTGCAQIIPPTGGPRDSIPPVMLGAVPKDSSINFKGNKVVLTFDEYIQLERPEEQLVISPVPKTNPVIEAKLKQVTIKIKDTLEENTTYSINFGKSLKDLNEGNPYKNFTYLFSTGSYIDSGRLSGKVVIAETGKPDSTLIVMLHRNFDDSAVIKEKPRYFTRLDSSGLFAFRNIAPGRYNLFALKDQSGQKIYSRNSDLFAFYDSAIVVGSGDMRPILYAFSEVPEEKKSGGPASSPSSAPKRGAAPKKEKKLSYSTNLSEGQQDLLSDFILTFNDSLVVFDESKLHFTDTLFQPVTGFTISRDTSGKIINLKYPWKEEQHFRLILEQGIAKDSSGLELAKPDTIKITTKKKADYGTLKLRVRNLDTAQHVVFLFFKADKLEQAEPAYSKELNFSLFHTGDYQIRILYDKNNNLKWDAGNYMKRIQPEKIISDSKKYTIRANWDNEITIELPASPPADVLK